jgi:hypothetical protein
VAWALLSPSTGGQHGRRSDKGGSPDRERINLKEDYEVRDWAKKFGVSEEELWQAVAKVGDRADAVRQHLGR